MPRTILPRAQARPHRSRSCRLSIKRFRSLALTPRASVSSTDSPCSYTQAILPLSAFSFKAFREARRIPPRPETRTRLRIKSALQALSLKRLFKRHRPTQEMEPIIPQLKLLPPNRKRFPSKMPKPNPARPARKAAPQPSSPRPRINRKTPKVKRSTQPPSSL